MRVLRASAVVFSAILLFLIGSSGGGLAARAAAVSTSKTDSHTLPDDLRVAIVEVNRYWAAHWSDFFTGTYRPPRLNQRTLGLYDGRSPNALRCSGERLPPLNAVYCPSGDFLAWDVTLLRTAYPYGDAFVYLTVAHEWGHAIQARLDRSIVSVASELQADCLAGAALYGAARDRRLQFEAGDEAEIVRGLSALADETPWTRSRDHGDVFQRVGAFRQGRTGGVRACFR